MSIFKLNKDIYLAWGIFLLFITLRLYYLDRVFLWNDELDFIQDTFEGEYLWHQSLHTAIAVSQDFATAPWLPMIITLTSIGLFGHHVLVLRIPSILVSILSFWILKLILYRLFSRSPSRLLPLLFFSFSIPSIIYSQSPHPSMYYFLSSGLLILCFLTVSDRISRSPGYRTIAGGIYLFGGVSLLSFVMNYMSLLVSLILTTWLGLEILRLSKGERTRKALFFLCNCSIAFMPLVPLVLLRIRMSAYRLIYRVNDIGDLLLYLYDFFTYHFNFAYTPLLYRPLQLNTATLPFILLCFGGAIYCLVSFPKQRIPILVAIGIFLAAGILQVMPLGGIRHSLTVAPFAYVLAGFGLESLMALGKLSGKARAISRAAITGLILLMLGVFCYSGLKVYSDRRSTLKIDLILKTAQVHEVTRIVGFRHTFGALRVWDATAGGVLDKAGIDLEKYHSGMNDYLSEKYLLVAYRHSFDPPFDPYVAWKANINHRQDGFRNVKVTVLREEIGPLKPEPDIMVHQSIYYPVNGCFIYLIEPLVPDNAQTHSLLISTSFF